MQVYVFLEMLTRGIVIETKAINSHYKVVFIYSKQINRDIFLLRFARITQNATCSCSLKALQRGLRQF
jgi:hypothetical protein